MKPNNTHFTGFPESLPEPGDYYRGINAEGRIRTRNALMFLRNSRATLQQRTFANRVHHRHVLVLVLETAGRASVDGQLFSLAPGDALLVLPYQFHHYSELQSDKLRWLFITFEIHEGERDLAETGHRVLHPGEEDLAIWRRMAGMWTGPVTRSTSAELLACLDQLLTRLAANSARRPPGSIQPAGKGSWIARVEALMAGSILRGGTVSGVARQAGLSERQLRTRFEREMGVSIRRYKAGCQLSRAASLMRQEELSLGRVAELSGFNSQTVFNRFIRRETGLTPSAWRKVLVRGDSLAAPRR